MVALEELDDLDDAPQLQAAGIGARVADAGIAAAAGRREEVEMKAGPRRLHQVEQVAAKDGAQAQLEHPLGERDFDHVEAQFRGGCQRPHEPVDQFSFRRCFKSGVQAKAHACLLVLPPQELVA